MENESRVDTNKYVQEAVNIIFLSTTVTSKLSGGIYSGIEPVVDEVIRRHVTRPILNRSLNVLEGIKRVGYRRSFARKAA